MNKDFKEFIEAVKDMPIEKLRNFKSVKKQVKRIHKKSDNPVGFLVKLKQFEPTWNDGINSMLYGRNMYRK